MTGRLAIGVGCRRDCPARSIEALVRQALIQVPPPDGVPAPRLFTVVDKAAEPGLTAAAVALGFELVALPREALEAVMGCIATPSRAAEAALGLASVSEAAALAGAGPGGRLVLLRLAAEGATCAIAEALS